MFRGACGSGGHTEDFNGYSHHSVAEFKKKKKQNTHLKRKKGDVTTTKKERAWLIEKRKQK